MFAQYDNSGRLVAFWATRREYDVLLQHLPDTRHGSVEARWLGVPIYVHDDKIPVASSRLGRLVERLVCWWQLARARWALKRNAQ